MDTGMIRLLHSMFRNCVTAHESNILLDIHPGLGMRAGSLGPYDVETFLH